MRISASISPNRECLPLTYSVILSADGVPILLRICKGNEFQHGPFSLGQWYLPLGALALGWVVVSTVSPSLKPTIGFWVALAICKRLRP